MANLAGQRLIVQAEELKSGVPASEGTMTRIGQQTNFLIEQPMHSIYWNLNGPYSTYGSTLTAIDGIKALTKSYAIFGVSAYAITAGSAGNLTFDIIVRKPSGATASIFSTNPIISYQSGNNARFSYRAYDSTMLFASSFVTAPVMLGTTTLEAGDFLQLNLLTMQTGGQDCGIQLDLLPI